MSFLSSWATGYQSLCGVLMPLRKTISDFGGDDLELGMKEQLNCSEGSLLSLTKNLSIDNICG